MSIPGIFLAVPLLLSLTIASARARDTRYGRITVTAGVTDRQVVPRGAQDKADLRLAGTAWPAQQTKLRFRITRGAQTVSGFDWKPIPLDGDGNWSTDVAGLPAGGPFRFEFSLIDAGGHQLDLADVDEVLVGDVWLLAGQSNMDGCGDLDDAERPHPMVRAVDRAGEWQVAEDPLHWAYGPRGPWPTWRPPDNLGAGLGIPFGKALYEQSEVPIGLILCSRGGTGIDQWSPRGKGDDASLYGEMLSRARRAGRVRGVLWYQGETDSFKDETAAEYEQKLTEFVQSLRADLQAPDLPFYAVQMARLIDFNGDAPENKNRIREAQRRAMGALDHCGLVASIDLEMSSGAHLNTEGYKRVGRRLATLALAHADGSGRLEAGPQLQGIAWDGSERKVLRVYYGEVNERLVAPGRVLGFSVRSPSSTGGDAEGVINPAAVAIDPRAPDCVVLTFDKSVPAGAVLWYGYGGDPICNLADARDMAAPAFGPLRLD